VQANFDWAFADAAKTFERALQLKPQYAVAHHWYAFNLLASGRGTEALAEARLAEQLDPLSLIIATAVAVHFYYAREYDHAILQCRKVLEMDPHFHTARSVMAGAYQQRGMHAEAIAELEQAMSVVGRSPALLALLGYTYGCLGRNLEFESVLRELGEPAGQRYVPPLYVATVYAGCGDIREALHWLELAYRDRDETLVMLGLEPRFDPLRADPAFTALVTRVRSGSSQAGEAVISG
jgi:tetratricopeptide (TPR) repeat protein